MSTRPYRLRLLIVALCLGPLVLSACNKADAGKNGGHPANASGDAPKIEETVPVECISASRGPISRFLATTSTLEAPERADVFVRANGIVKEVCCEEGDPVKAGQPLALLQEKEAALAEEKARLQSEKLRSDLTRKERMVRERLISQETFEEARHVSRQADVEWRQAQLMLENTRILSPIDGTVTARHLRVGELGTLNQKAYTVVDLRTLECLAFIPEKQITALRPDQSARILADALPGRVYDATILRISPVVDTTSGTVKATLRVENADGNLRAGMFVKVNIVLDTKPDALLLPKKTLLYQDGSPGVYILAPVDAEGNSTVRWTRLELGYSDAERVEVVRGVGPEDRIVIVGQHGLKEGTKVRMLQDAK